MEETAVAARSYRLAMAAAVGVYFLFSCALSSAIHPAAVPLLAVGAAVELITLPALFCARRLPHDNAITLLQVATMFGERARAGAGRGAAASRAHCKDFVCVLTRVTAPCGMQRYATAMSRSVFFVASRATRRSLRWVSAHTRTRRNSFFRFRIYVRLSPCRSCRVGRCADAHPIP